MKPPGSCIYCGRKGSLSKEHVFGQWHQKIAPNEHPRTRHMVSLRPFHSEYGSHLGKGRLNRNRAPHLAQLRVACERCNNSWMSAIQSNAKPHLEKLLSGAWPAFKPSEIEDICKWVKMVVISLEFAHPETAAVSAVERLIFSHTQAIGENWQILLGRTSENRRTGQFWHRGAAVFENASGAIPAKCNVQTTTFYLGSAFFHAISGPPAFLPDASIYAHHLALRSAWPLANQWRSAPLLFSADGVDRVGGAYWEGLGITGEPHFGMLHN